MAFQKIKQVNLMEMSGLLVGIFFTVAVMIFGLVLYTKLFTSGMIGVLSPVFTDRVVTTWNVTDFVSFTPVLTQLLPSNRSFVNVTVSL